MKILQTIKDYFAPAYSVKYANPVEDVKILSAIGREALFLTARNGKNYFYYFPDTENNLSLAKYLLVRNGVPAKSHITTYHYQFNALTKEEVTLPDLTGYTIKDSNENVIDE